MDIKMTARKWHAACQFAATLATLSRHAGIMVVRTPARKRHATTLAVTPVTTHHAAIMIVILKMTAKM